MSSAGLRPLHTAALVAAVVAAGCGARTALRTPDVAAGESADAPVACGAGRFDVVARQAEVMLVIDRSGSMDDAFDSRTGTRTRWTALREELAITLPALAARTFVGATFFPNETGGCTVNDAIDVVPATGQVDAILEVLRATHPSGETPTYEAMRVTSAFLEARADTGHARFIMLATDGGPTCNPHSRSVFDVDRTVDMIANTARHGIPTFVIGLDDPTAPGLADALRRMALAGGRPNVAPGAPRYYSVRNADNLSAAFRAIQRSVARCVVSTPARETPTAALALELGAAELPFDPTRADGWDWTDRAAGEITLFGEACDRVAASTETLSVVVRCSPDP